MSPPAKPGLTSLSYLLYGLHELDNVNVNDHDIHGSGVEPYVFKRDDLTEDGEDPLPPPAGKVDLGSPYAP